MGTTRKRKSPVPKKSKTGRYTKLTDKQEKFIDEYLTHFNGTKAARVAGYKAPASAAYRLLDGREHPQVAKEIGRRRQELAEKTEADRAMLLQYVGILAMANPADLVDENGVLIDNLHHLPLGLQHMIAGLKVKQQYNRSGEVIGQDIEIKLASKTAVLEMFAKLIGAFMGNEEGDERTNQETLDWTKLHEEAKKQVEEDEVEQLILDVKPTKKRSK